MGADGGTNKDSGGWTKKGVDQKRREGVDQKSRKRGVGPKKKGWLLNKILKDPLEHNLLFQRGQLEI